MPVIPHNGSGLKLNETAIALVAPMEIAISSETFIEVSVKIGDRSETLYVKGIPFLKAGYSYTYNLAVGKDVIYIESVTILEWSVPITVTGGVAE